MRMRKSVTKLLGIVTVVLVFLAVESPIVIAATPTPAQKTIELRLQFPYPEGDEMWIGLKYMCQELEKRTGGRVKITRYFGGALGKLADALDNLGKGIVDLAFFSPSMFPRVFRIPDAITLPSVRIPNRPLGTEIMYTLYHEGLMNKDYAGFKPLVWQGTTPMGWRLKRRSLLWKSSEN